MEVGREPCVEEVKAIEWERICKTRSSLEDYMESRGFAVYKSDSSYDLVVAAKLQFELEESEQYGC